MALVRLDVGIFGFHRVGVYMHAIWIHGHNIIMEKHKSKWSAGLPIQVRKLENPAFYPKRALYSIIFLFSCTDILTEGTAQEQFALAVDISIWRHIKRLIRVLEFFFIWH